MPRLCAADAGGKLMGGPEANGYPYREEGTTYLVHYINARAVDAQRRLGKPLVRDVWSSIYGYICFRLFVCFAARRGLNDLHFSAPTGRPTSVCACMYIY